MSAAIPRSNGCDAGRALLHDIEVETRSAIARTGEADLMAVRGILDIYLTDSTRREAAKTYLAAYISRCVTGVIPDHTRWEP